MNYHSKQQDKKDNCDIAINAKITCITNDVIF